MIENMPIYIVFDEMRKKFRDLNCNWKPKLVEAVSVRC